MFPASVTRFFYSSLQKIKEDRETSKQKVRRVKVVIIHPPNHHPWFSYLWGFFQGRVDFLQLMIDSQKNNTSEEIKGDSDVTRCFPSSLLKAHTLSYFFVFSQV